MSDETKTDRIIESMINRQIQAAQAAEQKRREEIVQKRRLHQAAIIESLGELWPELKPYHQFRVDEYGQLIAHFAPAEIELADFQIVASDRPFHLILSGGGQRVDHFIPEKIPEVLLQLRSAYAADQQKKIRAQVDRLYMRLLQMAGDMNFPDSEIESNLLELIAMYPEQEEKYREDFEKWMIEREKRRLDNANRELEQLQTQARLAEYREAYKQWLRESRKIQAENDRNFKTLQDKLDIPCEIYELRYGYQAIDDEGAAYIQNATIPVLGPDEAGWFMVLKNGEVTRSYFYNPIELTGPTILFPTEHRKCWIYLSGFNQCLYLNPLDWNDPDQKRAIQEIPDYIEPPEFEFDKDGLSVWVLDDVRREVEMELDNES